MAILVRFYYYFPSLEEIADMLYRLSTTRATLIALFCTTSEVFDVPVYWPILVVYFLTLFALTMRRQIQCVLFFKERRSKLTIG